MSGLLTAIDETNTKQLAHEVTPETAKSKSWHCPICSQELLYVKRSSTGRTSHFRHRTEATHASLSETTTHANAKQYFYTQLRNDNRCRSADLEHISSSTDDRQRIADIVLNTHQHGDIAVEIQCSPQSVEQFQARTDAYNEHGYAVLWLVLEETYLPEKSTAHVSGVAYKDAVKWLQQHYFGRCYAFSPAERSGETVQMECEPVRVEPATRSVNNDWASYTKTYQSIGYRSAGELPNAGLTTAYSNSRKIARFYDKAWWTGDSQ